MTATTEIYTLSLHDALPILFSEPVDQLVVTPGHENLQTEFVENHRVSKLDRKSTRLNSSHVAISYAVFCLKKKNSNTTISPSNYPATSPCNARASDASTRES